MAFIPEVYGSPAGSPVTYDWIDVISGMGYRKFYGLKDANNNCILSVRVMDSSGGITPATNKTKTSGTTFDIDFDITVKKPFTLGDGSAYINFSLSNMDTPGTYTTTAILRHVDAGASETDIGTANVVFAATGNNSVSRELLTFAVTKTAFKIGDILRLTITGASTSTTYNFHHDGDSGTALTESGSSADRTIPVTLLAELPFKIADL